jgi:hypothetical protein
MYVHMAMHILVAPACSVNVPFCLNPKLLSGGTPIAALTWAFASSKVMSSAYIVWPAQAPIMVAGRGRGFSVQKNLALFGVITGQGADIYALCR